MYRSVSLPKHLYMGVSMQTVSFYPESREFHLSNDRISYFINVMKNGQIGHLYFGKKIRERDTFAHFMQLKTCSHTSYLYDDDLTMSLDIARQEYPGYGTTDYRYPAFRIEQENGSSISNFVYKSHNIFKGKKKLEGLPAVYAETDEECTTLEITLEDSLTQATMILSYSVFDAYDAVMRNVRFVNNGTQVLKLTNAQSMAIDLYDSDFEMLQLDGAWSRERHVHTRKLVSGLQAVDSMRGHSSAEHNPFIALKRPETTECQGDAYGFLLVYSGNFLAQVEVNRFEHARVLLGINPLEFTWTLNPGDSFQTPEAVLVFSDEGLNGMSQTFHSLFNERLVRGPWRGKDRPVLINNWEGTYFDFNDEKILDIAEKAKEFGVELFVLDDGWFGRRDDASSSLGDWYSDKNKLVDGVEGLSKKITSMGLKFGLWFEPEMVNRDSELFRAHPEWAIATPGRAMSHGRNQYCLDFSNEEVVDCIYDMMEKVLRNSDISYVKWDMNRDITEAYGATLGSGRQGEFFHRYMLGVYRLYEKLIEAFPDILFESCASGGARFDAGMLYYAPQAWASDDTDAVERLKIQYGSSMAYPVSSIGAHVSAVPNHQLDRITALSTRANTAFFGAFGYELDPGKLTDEEKAEIKEQVAFFKKYRHVFQYGTFYRLVSPFDNNGNTSWMAVSEDKKTAVFAYYKVLATPNPKANKVRLKGLDPDAVYVCSRAGEEYFGDELMNMGFLLDMEYTGSRVRNPAVKFKNSGTDIGDFTSQLYVLERK